MPSLQQHLDRCYAQTIGHRHPDCDPGTHARQQFIEALATDPELRLAAQARRESLVDAVTDKCYQSKTYKQILDLVLGG